MSLTGRPSKIMMEEITSRVLDAARSAFCHAGLAGSSLDEIALQAGITKRTIYRRYPSKQALLDAVVERDLVSFHHWINTSDTEHASSLVALKEATRRFYQFSREPHNVAFSDFLIGESVFSQDMRQKRVGWEIIGIAPISERVKEAQKDGYIRNMDVSIATDLLIDLLFKGPLHRTRTPERELSELETTEFFDFRWHTFLLACGGNQL